MLKAEPGPALPPDRGRRRDAAAATVPPHRRGTWRMPGCGSLRGPYMAQTVLAEGQATMAAMSERTMTNPASAAAHPDQTWRSQYLVQRRRARIFMATTGLALAAFLGTLAYALTQSPEQPAAVAVGAEAVVPGTGEGPGGGLRALGGVEGYFHDDGSLDDEMVQRTLARFEAFGEVPEGFATRIASAVDEAVSAGTLTLEQGAQLLGALGLSGSGSDV